MNAPVVAIEDLPVGPAHAAVALSRGADGAVNVTVAVRCARIGRVAYFTAGKELIELGSTGIVMDAALSFAESMGFLFDDEEVEIRGAGGSRAAAKIWQRFLYGDADEPERLDYHGLDDRESAGTELGVLGSVRASDRIEAPEVEDGLDPLLSPIAPNSHGTVSREIGGTESDPPVLDVAPKLGTAAVPVTAPDTGLYAGPPLETDEEPFWLAIPAEEIPRQSAREPAPIANADDREPDFVRPEASERDRPEIHVARPATAGPDRPSDGRELLQSVLAETAVDRVCAPPPTPGPGLSKFRLKPSDPRPPSERLSDPPQRLESISDAAAVSEVRTAGGGTNPPRLARYHESTRRPHLLLRLLSRF